MKADSRVSRRPTYPGGWKGALDDPVLMSAMSWEVGESSVLGRENGQVPDVRVRVFGAQSEEAQETSLHDPCGSRWPIDWCDVGCCHHPGPDFAPLLQWVSMDAQALASLGTQHPDGIIYVDASAFKEDQSKIWIPEGEVAVGLRYPDGSYSNFVPLERWEDSGAGETGAAPASIRGN